MVTTLQNDEVNRSDVKSVESSKQSPLFATISLVCEFEGRRINNHRAKNNLSQGNKAIMHTNILQNKRQCKQRYICKQLRHSWQNHSLEKYYRYYLNCGQNTLRFRSAVVMGNSPSRKVFYSIRCSRLIELRLSSYRL